jgi:RNA polymerase sigma factor (TIGR02999 family)
MVEGGDVTVLLRQWSAGEDSALEPLFQLIYPQLRSIAASLMRQERPGHELQPTGVVNEFYLKLVQQQRLQFEDRAHFLSLAARFMRRLLVDQARERRSLKRNGGQPVALSDDLSWVAAAGPEILDVDRQLTELQQIDDRKCRMIELRYFLGFTVPEIAELLSLSKATVDRDLKFARAWVRDRLTKL